MRTCQAIHALAGVFFFGLALPHPAVGSAVTVSPVGPGVIAHPIPVGQPVTWHLETRLAPIPADTELPVLCGNLGRFDLKNGDDLGASAHRRLTQALPCAHGLECGVEVPPIYPSPAVTVEEARRAVPSWIPCFGAGCFAAVGSAPGSVQAPWVAVVDWNSLHGWSVGWTLLGIANVDPTLPQIPAVLFPLMDDPRLVPFSLRGVTDVHILTQLCAVLEAVEIQGAPPPAVLNMSFGRLWRPGEDKPAGTCDPTILGCQVARVLDRLVKGANGSLQNPRTVAVGGAGNEREKLFPAGLDTVLPAGSLQLARFKSSAKSENSWETPSYAPKAQAVMPGYGLCLQENIGTGVTNEWPAPAGTSYAAALFSGWLAATLATTPVVGPLGGGWYPLRVCPITGGACTYLFAHGDQSFPANPRVDQVIARMLTGKPCGSSTAVADAETMALGFAGVPASELPLETFLDIFPLFKNPTPASSPCVPCLGMTSINGMAEQPAAKAGTASFVVDLSALSPLLPPFPMALQAQAQVGDLLLHVTRDSYYRLKPVPGGPDLSTLTNGSIRRLVIPGLNTLIPRGEQPSLVFVLKSTLPELAGHPFWISIPIFVSD